MTGAGHELAGRAIVADDVEAIRAQVSAWVADPQVDLILTTGGTGFAPRDVTPEAVKPLLRREMDGFAAVFHQASLGTVGVSTLQSRAFAGQIGDTFIFCLPGSTGACRDGWDLVLALELDSRYRPCSLAGQIPRLQGSLRMSRLSHVGEDGRARMVDVSDKAPTERDRDGGGLPALPAARRSTQVRAGTAPKGAVDPDRRAGRHDGGQAHRRPDPALPSAAADQGRR